MSPSERIHRDERGFTLIELLVAMGIGVVVLLAAFTLLDSGAHSATRTSDRADVTQRGRTAMNEITRRLRSQVCFDSATPPIAAGDDTSVTFYADTDDDAYFAPQKVRVWLDTTWKGGRGAVRQQVWTGDFTGTPAENVLAEDVTTTSASIPFLTYYPFDTATVLSAPLDPNTDTPLPVNSIAKVLRVDVNFRMLPASRSDASGPPSGTQLDASRDGDFSSSIYLRNSDYTDQSLTDTDRTWGARCD